MTKNPMTHGLLTLAAIAAVIAGHRAWASCTAPVCFITTTRVEGAPGTSCFEYSPATAFDDIYNPTGGGGTIIQTGVKMKIRSNTCNYPTNCNPVMWPKISAATGAGTQWSPAIYNQQACLQGG
jgi:hypothetical protein